MNDLPDAALVIEARAAARFDPEPVNAAPACPLCAQSDSHEVCGVPPIPQPACPACGSVVVSMHPCTDLLWRCGGCGAGLDRLNAAMPSATGQGFAGAAAAALLGLR